MSDTESSSKLNPKKLTSNEEVYKAEQKKVLENQEHWTKYNANRPRRVAPSKAEIMEQLSRERFPEEE